MNRSTHLVLVILFFLISGCQSPTQEVQFVTEPAGATVTLDGENKGVTPLTLSGLKLRDYNMMVSLEGYKAIQDKIVVKSDPQPLKLTMFLVPVESSKNSSM